MAIVTVSTSNTFNEWRVVTNQLVTEVNKTESGTAALSVDTLTANTVTANGDIAVNGGDLTTTSATFNVANSAATTVNVGGAATTLNLGAATGTTTIRNDASVSGNTSITGTLGVTGNVTLSGELRGPSTFTIDPAVVGDDTGTVVIKGNLQVDGTTTTINSTTLTVDDLNIVLASGAANAAAANGAGITIDGASATITYLSSGDKFKINKALELDSTLSVTGAATLTANPTLSAGTANGVLYLNGSKVVTSDSALTFDGTNLGVGVSSASAPLDIQSNSGGTGIRVIGRASANTGAIRYFANDNTTQRARIESNDTGLEINSVANLPTYFLVNDSEQMRLTSTGLTVEKATVINESGGDNDFRVESDNNSYMLWVDASADGVNIGGSDTIQGQLNVIKNTGDLVASTTALYITTGQTYGNGANKKNLDLVFQGYRDGAGTGGGAKARLRAIEQTGDSRLGLLQISTLDTSGNLQNNLALSATEVVVNDDSIDMDFRVESDNNANMFFVDGGTDQVVIGGSTPSTYSTLTVYRYGTSGGNNAEITIDASANSGSGQGALRILAGSGSTNRASRLDFFQGATSTTTPRWTLINDYDQNGTNDLRIVGAGASPKQFITIQNGVNGIIFNEDSYDQDFRVESDGSTHMFFVDASTDRIGIRTSTPTTPVEIYTGNNHVTLTTTDGVGSSGFYGLKFRIDNTGHDVAQINGMYTSSGGGGYGGLTFKTVNNGSMLTKMELFYEGTVAFTNQGAGSSFIWNEDGADSDFRVESDTNTHALFVDAGNDVVGIGTSTPNTFGGKLAVAGHIVPTADNTYDLGSASYSWANVYTGDLHLSNMKKETGNEVDGTKGDWTIQEGENDLYILNNRNGKKYRFKLEEIV